MKFNLEIKKWTGIVAVILLVLNINAQDGVQLVEVSDGFFSPVDIKNAGDERLFIVEQSGKIKILNPNGTINTAPFLNIESLTNGGGEQGLLGVAFHPDYATNGFFFVNYTNNNGDSRIVRYSVSGSNPDLADMSSALPILSQDQPFGNHNAGSLNFGPDGYLYIPFGDGGSGGDPMNNAQNPQTFLGKMLRIDVDGGVPYGIPTDNPFASDDETLDEIWAIGLRNTWKFSFDAETGDLWMADVGQNAWEEIDMEPSGSAGGLNYGWRCYEGMVNYDQSQCPGTIPNITEPISVYNHNNGACSVTGGYVYRGSEFPEMYGRYYYTDYCNGQFRYIEINGGVVNEGTVIGGAQGFGWSSFGESSTNELYVANLDGTIYRLAGACYGFSVDIEADGDVLTANQEGQYVWFLNGVEISGENGQSLVTTENGTYTVQVLTDNNCEALSSGYLVTGIEELSASVISISPNPANDILVYALDANDQFEAIVVYDSQGKIVFENRGVDSGEIDVHAFAEGVYYLEIQGGAIKYRAAFIVKH